MKSLGLKPVGVKTDCLLYEGDVEIVRKNFQIGENIGDFRIEKGKYVSETILKIENNELMDIIDYSKCIPKEFDDEKDTKVINEFLEQNKNIFVRALNPGCGKSTLVKNFNKKTLFVLTENTLCRDVRKEGIDAITADRLFGSFGNQRKPFDYSAYGCICFDEIGKYGLDKLKLISNFIYNNPDIYIYGAGDSDQN